MTTKNLRFEKKLAKYIGPKIVRIDRHHVNKTLNTIFKLRSNIRNIMAIIELDDNMGHVISNMIDQDALYFIERWKHIRIGNK